MRYYLSAGLVLMLLVLGALLVWPQARLHTIRRYAAPEATQAVAVDGTFFYAIDSAAIGKYDKRSGQRVASWKEQPGGRVAHLNSGLVLGDELYCAHSNYPETPMVSSLEVFDTKRMAHLRSTPLPNDFGSATWIEKIDDAWWVAFAHYAGKGGVPGKGPEATRLVQFDPAWRQQGSWSFPNAVVARWDGMSSSGGARISGRRFYTTGHHAPEVYIVEVPESGTELQLREILTVEGEGQGIALDRTENLLYSIRRRTQEVIVSKLPR
jgi:hypothetical protein